MAPPNPPPAPKPTNFVFPFRGADKKPIVDEHVLHAWLADETSGNFAASQSGMWHGGIHVSADGAGKHLDLAHGVRCIADGHVIAYLIHRTYLTSQIAATEGEHPMVGQYSAAFTLVRHALEYPAGNQLTFFSLYMHLQSLEDYRKQGAPMPPYWPKAYEVTEHASNRPLPDPHQGAAPPEQIGQNIRSQPGMAGTVLGVLQRGARVRIGARSPDRKWGRIEAIESGTVLPPKVATLPGEGVETGWVYLAKEQGHWPLAEVVSEAQCDQIITPEPIPIKAGDLIGHLGQYWLPDSPEQDHRMVHVEAFCGSNLPDFLAKSRAAAKDITDLDKLPLLRIGHGVKLFAAPSSDGESANAPQTAVVQIYSQAALDALPAEFKGSKDSAYGNGQPWWYVNSANSLHHDIRGWVRNRQMPPDGGVTRESPHAWIDFETVNGADAGNPTLFNTADDWADYVLRANKPATAAVDKLKPLACDTYRALSPMRNELRAADEMCALGDTKWLRFRASRLIPRHRSEWASGTEYQSFFETVLQRIEEEPYHQAEIERVKQMVWWDKVKDKNISGFPASPEVFHIHPIALAGNFSGERQLITMEMLIAVEPGNSRPYYESILPHLNKYAEAYKVNTPKRIAHFLSQSAHESALKIRSEDLDYSARNMRKTFGCRGGKKNHDESCDDCTHGRLRDKLWSQAGYYAHSPEHLGSYVYADRMGNGAESTGEGFKYRGRGIIQITGKEGYQSFREEHNKRSPDDAQDFVSHPELISDNTGYAVESAFVFWSKKSLNSISDSGNVASVTQIVNGGQNGFTDRLRRYNNVAPILGLPQETQ